jgi:hypothetical protein
VRAEESGVEGIGVERLDAHLEIEIAETRRRVRGEEDHRTRLRVVLGGQRRDGGLAYAAFSAEQNDAPGRELVQRRDHRSP